MKKFFLMVVALTLSTTVRAEDTLVLSDVSLEQDRRTQEVTVTYRLTGDSAAYVMLDIRTNGTSIGLQNIKTLTGDVSIRQNGRVVSAGDGVKKIVWNAGADWPGQLGNHADAQILAWHTNEIPNVYMKVGLEDGAISYVTEEPDWGSPAISNACRTTDLWLRLVLPGSYQMGSPTNEAPGWRQQAIDVGRYYEAQHWVTLTRPFFLGVFEVTEAQYARVFGNTGSDQNAKCNINYNDLRGDYLSTAVSATWPESNEVAADSFMGRLRAKTGIAFDLPTEAEWEYACRAGSTNAYYNGTEPVARTNDESSSAYVNDANLNRLAWTGCNSQFSVHIVGLKEPNAWGFYDILGNVNEFCLDWQTGDFHSDSATDPKGKTTETAKTTQMLFRVRRGGGFNGNPTFCRCAAQLHSDPDDNGAGKPYNGFRVSLRLE